MVDMVVAFSLVVAEVVLLVDWLHC
jgi:hypothetical protein